MSQDGFSTGKGVVRRKWVAYLHEERFLSVVLEFVAAPLGQGLTVEAQLTGKEVRFLPAVFA